MHTKVMRWTHEHRDHYIYNHEQKSWRKVACRLGREWDTCTAPSTFPRGTKFDYNGKVRA